MYEQHLSTARHYLADVAVAMPLNILLALPDYVTDDPGAPLFNLPATVSRLLGQFGWERASKILNPQVWAPAWTPDRIQRFASSPFHELPELFLGAPAQHLAVPDFPGTGALRQLDRPDLPEYEIIHFIGAVDWRDGDPALRVSANESLWMHANPMNVALQATRTRLLILQIANHQFGEARAVAERVVDAGGPATLVVASMDPGPVSAYLTDVYAGIVHNNDLANAVQPKPQLNNYILAHLFFGDGSLDVLRFDRWLELLRQRATQLAGQVHDEAERMETSGLRERASPLLHQSQMAVLDSRLGGASRQIASIEDSVQKITAELHSKLSWAHESGGAEPLSRIAELLPTLEVEAAQASRLYPELEAEVAATIDRAPRVMNANFADPTSKRVLAPLEGLVAGEQYDLLVDIGPRWNTIPTVVSGQAEFPEKALPADLGGNVIDVVLASDDFKPNVVAAKLWLPQSKGRSHPMVGSEPDRKSGPVALRIIAPALENPGASPREVQGRLFFYFENNLLQSALATASVIGHRNVTLDRQNQVKVDYAFTGTFRDLGSQYARRAVRLASNDSIANHPVRVNLTLNHNGSGTHRILVRGRDDLPPAWSAYDPAAALKTLRSARRTIAECFGKRDENGDIILDGNRRPVSGLDSRNGKNRDQFCYDLYFLAEIGSTLYKEMIHLLRPASGAGDPLSWEAELRSRLDAASVIQVSRIESAPTQYAFPWALLYEYPLPGAPAQWQWCKVLSLEWSKDGVRQRPIAPNCPFKDEPWHKEDVLCPYGFWGLKHVIEQPLVAVSVNGVALADAVKEIQVREINLAVGWTRDTALDLPYVDAHIRRVGDVRGLRMAVSPSNPADDRQTMRALMTTPNLIYFLCHCENDAAKNQSYLHLGPRDGDAAHKIYVETVTDWARTTIRDWRSLKPLVFINGCQTADLEPGEILTFVSAFGLAGAAGIIGTEVSVQLRLAVEVAERLFEKMVATDGGKLGQALREIRWELANKGNLLGLCYTPYGLADLQFVRGPLGAPVDRPLAM